MFQTLELQYLKKRSKGKIGDFSSPEAFQVSSVVERLSSDPVTSSTQIGRKVPMPISTLVGDFTVKSRECSDSTPPIVRTSNFSAQSLVEFSQFVQRMLQGVRRRAYLIVVGSHGVASYPSLTPLKWVGNRHVTLRLRLNSLPTGRQRV